MCNNTVGQSVTCCIFNIYNYIIDIVVINKFRVASGYFKYSVSEGPRLINIYFKPSHTVLRYLQEIRIWRRRVIVFSFNSDLIHMSVIIGDFFTIHGYFSTDSHISPDLCNTQ